VPPRYDLVKTGRTSPICTYNGTMSVLLILDGGPPSPRALRVALSIAKRAGLTTELLLVIPDGADQRLADHDLNQLASEAGPEVTRTTSVVDNDVSGTIAAEIARRPDALVVIGTNARGPVAQLLLGNLSEDVLAATDRPLLLVGPKVDARSPVGPALVAGVAEGTPRSQLASALREWAHHLGGDTWLLHVTSPTDAATHHPATDERSVVLEGADVVGALIEFTTSVGGGVIAVASDRWVQPHKIHWASTTRALVRRSRFPILAVPIHDAPVGRAAR
jgi:nucleotide-binding universal stress UspA family protein